MILPIFMTANRKRYMVNRRMGPFQFRGGGGGKGGTKGEGVGEDTASQDEKFSEIWVLKTRGYSYN